MRALRALRCPPLLLLLLRHPPVVAAASGAVEAGGSFLADALSGVSACCDPHRYTYDVVCVNNNLGGRGPDRYKAPARPNEETLRYRGIPAADGRTATPRSVDLVVSATSSYATRSPYKNGLHGSLIQINVDAGNTVDLDLQLRDSTTDHRVTASEMTLLVLDLDEDIGRMSRTAISARGYDDSFVSDSTQLREVELKNNATWFLSQKAGSENDEPTDCCGDLFESQLDKAVAFHFTDTSRVELKVHVSYGRSSHNFLLSLQLCTSCVRPATHRPPTPSPRPHSHRSKVHLESSNRVETILWSIQDLLHLPHGKDDNGPQPQPGPPPVAGTAESQVLPTPAPAPLPTPKPMPVPTPPPGGRLPLEGHLPEGEPPDPQPEPEPIEEPQPEPEPPLIQPPAPQPPEPVETGGFPPSKPDGNPWPMAGNRACHGSEVMWAWCKGECIGSCGSCGCAGSPCHADFESDKQVPLDCALSSWSAWTTCSTTCGIGWHNRMRHVVQPPEHGGQPCRGSLWQMDSCQSAPCSDRSFVLGHWSNWQGCDSRSPGFRFRKRDVREVNGGSSLPSDALPTGTTKQVDICPNVQERNCVLSQWSEWENCNQPCGGGQTYRRRSLEMLPTNGGHCSPETLQQARPCQTMPCPDFDNCQLGQWCPWSACSRECPGSHTRSRDIIRNEQFCAAPLKEIGPCHQPGCVQTDCKWADWGQWGACTCDCGGGTKRRNRQLAAAPKNGGKLCNPQDQSEITACNTQSCEVCEDGQWGPWTRWTPCSAKCGSGVRYRHRDIAKQANDCGKPAVGAAQQFVVCHSSGGMGVDCGDRDCMVGQWSSWSACSCSCFGIRERTRTIAQFQKGNGKPCTDVELKTVEPCNPGPGQEADGGCGQEKPPVDCTVSPWSVWGQCSVTCGGGNRERSRAILTPAANNGRPCGTTSLEEMEQCSLDQCTQGGCMDCLWGPWSEWGSCTKCGGEKYRQRIIKQLPNYCGRPCDSRPAREVTSCTSHCHKTQYCAWNGWAVWGDCSHSCGVAVRSRQRFLGLTPLRPPEYLLIVESGDDRRVCHGTQTVTEQCLPFVNCQQDCTPTDCQFSGWTDWVDRLGCVGLCERRRQVRVVNNECGKPCSGPLEETTTCAPTHCHVTDCRLSPWSDWTCVGMNGDCSGQSKRRTRSVQQEPQNGGRACTGALEETKVCGSTDRPPASPCTLDDWSDWSICTASCGSGWHTRFRSIRTLAMNGGRLCKDSLEEGEMCTLQPCPDDSQGCTLSSWSEWRGCMDYGQQFRSRELNPATGRRFPCNAVPGQLLPVRETRPCDQSQSFVVDCTVSPWTEWYTCDKTCGGGEQQRDRQVEAYPLNGGHKCPRDLRMIRGCNTQPCEAPKPSGSCKDGSWEPWAPWSQCSTTCGGGISWRTRLRAEMATECGKPATGLSRETKYCVNERPCTPDVDCRLSEWSLWSGCTKTCDGIKSRSRKIQVHGQGHGSWCRGPTKETRACRPCDGHPAIDCLLGEWGSWSECPVTCGVSQMRRERLVTQEARHGGRACDGSLVDIRDCGLRLCPSPPPVDCLWGQWGPWGACSEPGGQRNRFRRILRQAKFGGQPCEVGAVEQTVGCKRPHYESFCMWAQWEAWSPCTDWTPCRTWGKRSRVRHLVLSQAGAAVPSTAINSNIDSYSTYYETRQADAKGGADQQPSRPQWLSAQSVRLEVLAAFVCGYFGRVVVAAGGRAVARRRGEASPRMGSAFASARAWLGGSQGAALHQGYMPVAQAPFEA